MIRRPANRISGTVELPGDKSISHRAAMLAAIARGTSRIENFASSADCASTLACLAALGVEIDRQGHAVVIEGVGKRGFIAPKEPLDCGNSGTSMRLLAGILAGQEFESTLTGDESLSGRPMKRIIDPLERMGASISATEGHAPLVISGRYPLEAIEFSLPVASAQLKSAVLLAGLYASGETTIVEPVATRDHTERMLTSFGVPVATSNEPGGANVLSIRGESALSATDLRVPSDISSAAFFLVAAAGLQGSELNIRNVGLNPTRIGIIDVLRRFGMRIEISNEGLAGGEPFGDIHVVGARLTSENSDNRIDGPVIANLIDEVPILAVFGTQVPGGLEIRDASELRIKESDRIAAVVQNLRRMNANVTEYPDGLRVERSDLKGSTIDSLGDHRIAMAFAVAALFAEGESEILRPECAAVSFPEFYGVLDSVTVG